LKYLYPNFIYIILSSSCTTLNIHWKCSFKSIQESHLVSAIRGH